MIEVVDLIENPSVTWDRPLAWSADVAEALRVFAPECRVDESARHFGCPGAEYVIAVVDGDEGPMCVLFVVTQDDDAYRFAPTEFEHTVALTIALSEFQQRRSAAAASAENS